MICPPLELYAVQPYLHSGLLVPHSLAAPFLLNLPALHFIDCAVVDSHTFIQDYSSRASLAARPDLGEGGNLRPVVDLLVEQIE